MKAGKLEKKKMVDKIKFDFIGIKYLFPSRGYVMNPCYSFCSLYKEDVLVPKIDDSGNVSGSNMMYYIMAWEMDKVSIKKDKFKESFKESNQSGLTYSDVYKEKAG
jgi:hypothetical protein